MMDDTTIPKVSREELKFLYEELYNQYEKDYNQWLTSNPLDLSLLNKRYHEDETIVLFYHSDCSFSNFSPHKVPLDYLWPNHEAVTSENIFQCGKYLFGNPEYAKQIALSSSPFDATSLGRKRDVPGFDPEWNTWSHLFMCDILLRKASHNRDNREQLLATGDKWLIENTARGAHIDNIWGAGKLGTGANKLGICLMAIRKLFQTVIELLNKSETKQLY